MDPEEQEQAVNEEAENTEQPGAEPETGDESTEQQPAEQPAEEPAPEASGFQKRINKVTAEKHEYRRRAEEAEELLKKYSQPKSPTAKAAPTLEEFDYDEDKYRTAAIDYQVDQRFKTAQEERTQRDQQDQRGKAADDFAKKISLSNVPNDYSEKIDNMARTIPLQNDVVSAIQHADNGPELAYYLAENLDVADSIQRMPPSVRTMEIGKISAQLSAGKKTAKPASKAAAPVRTVKSGGSSAKNIYDVDADVSMAEIRASK